MSYPVSYTHLDVYKRQDNNRAKGGCYVFHQNRIVAALPLGNTGVLEFELD